MSLRMYNENVICQHSKICNADLFLHSQHNHHNNAYVRSQNTDINNPKQIRAHKVSPCPHSSPNNNQNKSVNLLRYWPKNGSALMVSVPNPLACQISYSHPSPVYLTSMHRELSVAVRVSCVQLWLANLRTKTAMRGGWPGWARHLCKVQTATATCITRVCVCLLVHDEH